jgi:hypothetical protein
MLYFQLSSVQRTSSSFDIDSSFSSFRLLETTRQIYSQFPLIDGDDTMGSHVDVLSILSRQILFMIGSEVELECAVEVNVGLITGSDEGDK